MSNTKRLLNIACLQTSPQPDFHSALDLAISLGEEAIANGEYPIDLDAVADMLLDAYKEMKS